MTFFLKTHAQNHQRRHVTSETIEQIFGVPHPTKLEESNIV